MKGHNVRIISKEHDGEVGFVLTNVISNLIEFEIYDADFRFNSIQRQFCSMAMMQILASY